MDISVVIPNYNSEDTIVDALNSVLSQTKVEYIKRIIIIDDASTDNSVNVINDYIKSHSEMDFVFLCPGNNGVSKTRNIGMSLVETEWIAFLDSDDEWRSNKIERQVEVIKDHPDIDFLGANPNTNPMKILFKKINGLYKASYIDLCLKPFPVTPSVVMRKKIFDQMGGFDEKQSYYEDANYFMHICLKYNYYHLPEHLVDIGHGKKPFGEKGLSANLKGMYIGAVKLIKDLKRENVISMWFFIFLRIFYYLKHIRRIIIVKANL